jgi:hypothetical protein
MLAVRKPLHAQCLLSQSYGPGRPGRRSSKTIHRSLSRQPRRRRPAPRSPLGQPPSVRRRSPPLLPFHLIAHRIMYGDALESGYIPLGDCLWRSTVLLAVLFSANHGLLAWTPILILSVIGLVFFWRRNPAVGGPFFAAAFAFYLFIASYPDWAGISSYGSRFFVSLPSSSYSGLAVFLDPAAKLFPTAAPQFSPPAPRSPPSCSGTPA